MPDYLEKWRDPALNARIDAEIERNRKGDAVLEVVGQNGRPIKGAKVVIRQISHEFLFGCNAFVLGQLPEEKEKRYEEAFLRLFNSAVTSFFWEATEPKQGQLHYTDEPGHDLWRRPPPDRVVAWAEAHGLVLQGGPLLWYSFNPPWLPQDDDALRKLYRKRFAEIAGRYGSRVSLWITVNESLYSAERASGYPLYTPDLGYVAWGFAEASSVFPDSDRLLINEATRNIHTLPVETNKFLLQVDTLLSQGVPIDGIGIQFHFFRRKQLDDFLASDVADPVQLLNIYKALSKLDRPLYITEITIGSAGKNGEALQAEVVKNLYRLWFSVPQMAGITWWNLGDSTAFSGSAAIPNNENDAQGGLLDADFNPKAAYRILDQLINQEWRTQVQLETGTEGEVRFRGFFGKYEVEVTKDGVTRRANLEHGSKTPVTHRVEVKW